MTRTLILFEDIIEEDLDQIDNKFAEAKREQNIMAQTIDLFCKFANNTMLNMSNLACSLHRKIIADNALNERTVKCSNKNKLLGEYYGSIKKKCRDVDEQCKEFQLRQHETIKSVKNKFVEVNDLLHERLHKLFPDTFNKLLELLQDEKIEYYSNQLWMQSDSEDKLKDALKDLDGAIQHKENLSELEHELCQLWKACLDIENNQCSLKERINSYITLITSVETLRKKMNSQVARKILFEQANLAILIKIDKISTRVEIFLDAASSIIFVGVKRVNKLQIQHVKAILSAQQTRLREMKETAQAYIKILSKKTSLFSGTEE